MDLGFYALFCYFFYIILYQFRVFCLCTVEEGISEMAFLEFHAYFSAHKYLTVSDTQRLFVMSKSGTCVKFFVLNSCCLFTGCVVISQNNMYGYPGATLEHLFPLTVDLEGPHFFPVFFSCIPREDE